MRLVACTLFVFLTMAACDAAWLGAVMKNTYQSEMKTLLAPTANLAAAAGFYILYAASLSYVVVRPVVSAGRELDWKALVFRSAVFGLAAYGTYDLTGLSVIRDWPAGLSLIDMGWGVPLRSSRLWLRFSGCACFGKCPLIRVQPMLLQIKPSRQPVVTMAASSARIVMP